MSLKIKLPLTQFWSEIIKVWCETAPKILSLTVKQWDLATMQVWLYYPARVRSRGNYALWYHEVEIGILCYSKREKKDMGGFGVQKVTDFQLLFITRF